MTDTIIPNDSCHPHEQKHAAIRYLTNRMNTYNLSNANRREEENTTKHILHNKKYYVSVLDRIKRTQHKTKHNTKKWAKFIYIGKEKIYY
jgi:hypothetical protein